MTTKQSMEEFIAMKAKEYRDTIVGWQEEVIRLQNVVKEQRAQIADDNNTIINLREHVALLQRMVNSYQADNERDYSAHD